MLSETPPTKRQPYQIPTRAVLTVSGPDLWASPNPGLGLFWAGLEPVLGFTEPGFGPELDPVWG